jgi:hypothetical protein
MKGASIGLLFLRTTTVRVHGQETPGLGTSPPGSIDPGHGHILQDDNAEERQRYPVIIQQVHKIAA